MENMRQRRSWAFDTFARIDRDKNRTVDRSEFKEGLERIGFHVDVDEFEMLRRHFDKDNSAQIDLNDCKGALSQNSVQSKDTSTLTFHVRDDVGDTSDVDMPDVVEGILEDLGLRSELAFDTFAKIDDVAVPCTCLRAYVYALVHVDPHVEVSMHISVHISTSIPTNLIIHTLDTHAAGPGILR